VLEVPSIEELPFALLILDVPSEREAQALLQDNMPCSPLNSALLHMRNTHTLAAVVHLAPKQIAESAVYR
jgi:hypothetical protein